MDELWLAGRYTAPEPWEVLGIFDTEDKAVRRCTQDSDFVGPFILNEVLPEERVDIPNMYYPSERMDKQEDER
jgi:hypothetical protein